jgi:hypothetical protein
MAEVYGADVYAYLVRARRQLDSNNPSNLFYAAFELRCAIESRLQQYLDARDDIAKRKKKGWRIAASQLELMKIFRDGRTIVELLLSAPGAGEIRLFFTPVRENLVKAGDRLGNLLHRAKSTLDYDDRSWSVTRDFLEATFTELEFAAAGTLLAPPMMSRDGRQMHLQSFIHRSNPGSDVFDRFIALPRGTHMTSKVRRHAVLPKDAVAVLNSWRFDVI